MAKLIREYVRAALLAVVDVAKIVVPHSFWLAIWLAVWGVVGCVLLLALMLIAWFW